MSIEVDGMIAALGPSAGAIYVPPGGGTVNIFENRVEVAVSLDVKMDQVQLRLGIWEPIAGEDVTFTVRRNGAATGIATTISGGTVAPITIPVSGKQDFNAGDRYTFEFSHGILAFGRNTSVRIWYVLTLR